jgi:hypothetical protein
LRVGGLYFAAVVSSLHRDEGRDDLAITIEAKDCKSDVDALVELYKVSLSLLNHARELCENQAGNFADWKDL